MNSAISVYILSLIFCKAIAWESLASVLKAVWRYIQESMIILNAHIHMTPQYGMHSITVYPKKYAHGFVVLCFVVVTRSLIMNSYEVFIHIHQGYFAGTGAIVRLPQCQWSKPGGFWKISQCITTTKHSKAKTVCIFLGIYCTNYLGDAVWNAWFITEVKVISCPHGNQRITIWLPKQSMHLQLFQCV